MSREACWKFVSIPLRGKGLRKGSVEGLESYDVFQFPSPYGEKVSEIKNTRISFITSTEYLKFPSPYGEKV